MGTRVVKKVGIFDSKETIAAKIPIADMVIDDYQGHVNKRVVDKIASKWNDSAAGAVILNMREDNTYAVLDGQHRVLAAKKVGVSDLNALVFVGKSREEEARLFVMLNTKHNVSSIDRFRANLVAGNIREKNIRIALREVGLEIGLDHRMTPDSVTCAAALINIFDNFGLPHLKTTLGILTSAFHEYPDRRKAYSQSAMIGTAQFLYRYPEADVPRLIAKLKVKSPTVLTAIGEAKLDIHSDLWTGWGKMLVALYNEGLSQRTKSKLLDSQLMTTKKYNPAALDKLRNNPTVKENRLRNLQGTRGQMSEEARKAASDRMKQMNEARRLRNAQERQAMKVFRNNPKVLKEALAAAAKGSK